ncbi:hypothetical protein BZA70DRAFT_279785 [Myxozyma melibiosi]|uniref:WHIM1 domain-containing protein n=1 Tax=Myxozyma melibiosi TaxID=54550 RepID=A0ABR1F4E8_9ASCO
MSVGVSLPPPPSDLALSKSTYSAMMSPSPVVDSLAASATDSALSEKNINKRPSADYSANASKRVKQRAATSPGPSDSRDLDASSERVTSREKNKASPPPPTSRKRRSSKAQTPSDDSSQSSSSTPKISIVFKQNGVDGAEDSSPAAASSKKAAGTTTAAASRKRNQAATKPPTKAKTASKKASAKSAKGEKATKADKKKVQTKLTRKKKGGVVIASAANGSAKKAKRQTKLRTKVPPLEVVEPPEFNPIITDLDENELQLRLFIREYVLRFEKHCGLTLKHLNIIDDVTGPWTDMTFKTVIVAVLRIIYSDNYPVVDGDLLKNAIKEVEKTASHNEYIWELVIEILANRKGAVLDQLADEDESADDKTAPPTRASSVESTDNLDDTNDTNDNDSGSDLSSIPSSPSADRDSVFKTATPYLEKLNYISELIKLSLTGSYIRETIDIDNESLRRKTASITAELKAMSERHASELAAVRQTLKEAPKARKEEWEQRCEAVKARCDKEMNAMKEDLFRRKRKLCLRNMPIGMDIYGNQYWLFSDRMKSRVSWGTWIMCCKASELPSPTGTILFPKKSDPKKPAEQTKSAADATDAEQMHIDHAAAAADDDDAMSTSSELSDTLLGNNNNWFAIETREDAAQLTKWIKYASELTFRSEEKAAAKRRADAKKKVKTEEKPADDAAESSDSDDSDKEQLAKPILYDDFLDGLYSDKGGPPGLISPKKRAPRNELATKESIDALVQELQQIAAFMPSKDGQKWRR